MSRERYRVLVVEPSAIVANGIVSIISDGGEFNAVGCLDDISMLFERMVVLKPDIVLLNPSLFEHNRALDIRSMHPALQSVALIAVAYTPQPELLLKQFDAVISLLDEPRQIIRRLKEVIEHRDQNASDGQSIYAVNNELSDREKEILIGIAYGMTNKEIADNNNISIHTVISHRKNITRKIGIKTVAGLTIYAILNNLIDIQDVE